MQFIYKHCLFLTNIICLFFFKIEHYGNTSLSISNNNSTWSTSRIFHYDTKIRITSIHPNFAYNDVTTPVIVFVSHLHRFDNSKVLLHQKSELFCQFGEVTVPVLELNINTTGGQNWVYCDAPPQIGVHTGKAVVVFFYLYTTSE